MNILDTIITAQDGAAVRNIGSQFGLGDDQATAALSAVIPRSPPDCSATCKVPMASRGCRRRSRRTASELSRRSSLLGDPSDDR